MSTPRIRSRSADKLVHEIRGNVVQDAPTTWTVDTRFTICGLDVIVEQHTICACGIEAHLGPVTCALCLEGEDWLRDLKEKMDTPVEVEEREAVPA